MYNEAVSSVQSSLILLLNFENYDPNSIASIVLETIAKSLIVLRTFSLSNFNFSISINEALLKLSSFVLFLEISLFNCIIDSES